MLQALKNPPEGLFWSAPLVSDSDFTMEDPLALDYLGQQVGLWLFPGFTTRTGRGQNYAVVLYGLHLAEKAISKYGYPGDDETRTWLFERWERFWALATVESRNRQLAPGDEDAMRGVRGVNRAWSSGEKPLPLDFPLISRQKELGSLGAYLSSLREYGLVFPGTLRVTPAAHPILDAFWLEQGRRESTHRYEEYALKALDRKRIRIERKSGGLTLGGVGARSRLSSLSRWPRTKQQSRLWESLFLKARDESTLPLAERLITADQDGVHGSELLLVGLRDGRWGVLDPELFNKVEAALAFGRLARVLLTRFNRTYGYVDRHGPVAEFSAVADASFPVGVEMEELRKACAALQQAIGAARFRRLQYHGPQLLNLLIKLTEAGSDDCLVHLLDFHSRVQRSRRGGGAWLRREQGKVILQMGGYNGYKSDARFPEFKLDVVRGLLADLGKTHENPVPITFSTICQRKNPVSGRCSHLTASIPGFSRITFSGRYCTLRRIRSRTSTGTTMKPGESFSRYP